jgi:hypothetical protein
MRILFLTHAFNSLTQRLFVELREWGHEVAVDNDINDEVVIGGSRTLSSRVDCCARFAAPMVFPGCKMNCLAVSCFFTMPVRRLSSMAKRER